MSDQSEPYSQDLIDEQSIATGLTQRAIDRILGFAEKAVLERWARHKNRTLSSFSRYLQKKTEQCKKIRNLLSDTQSASIDEIYVPTRILIGSSQFTKDEFLRVLVNPNVSNLYRSSHAAVVKGAAGSGKSIFMKRAFIDLQKLSVSRIPILLELRHLNTRKFSNPTVPDNSEWAQIIGDELNQFGGEIPNAQVEDALSHGLFIILLDGVDEIKPKIQKIYERLILSFSKKYGECPIVVAGRPMSRMLAWQDFSVYDIAPLTVKESIELVERANFAPNIKDRFIRRVQAGLDPAYDEFLRTPL